MFAANVFDHVLDSSHWHIFETQHLGIELPFGLTKYMVLMVVAAFLIMAIFIPLARRASTGEPPSGVFWNFFESILTFIRDNIARAYITAPHDHGHTPALASASADAHAADHGHSADHSHADASGHDDANFADRYVPFLWTMFLFILICNLLGLVPFGGSPTGAISVTAALAVITFFFIHGSAMARMGALPYLKSIVPNLDLPLPIKIFVTALLAPIEYLGHFIKAFVLAMRLFANVFAGHMVLAVLLLFIVAVKDAGLALFVGVTALSVFGVLALSFLELFVAFLQAYIFTFLTALFLGAALNPEH